MVSGVIRQERPFVPIMVGWRLGVQEHAAIIDTGFTGDLKLSAEKAAEIGLEFTHTQTVKLANGQTHDMPASIAHVSLDGGTKIATALIAPGDTIIGVGLLTKFKFTLSMNFVDQWVTLEGER
jgi:predicted aspartyl protease